MKEEILKEIQLKIDLINNHKNIIDSNQKQIDRFNKEIRNLSEKLPKMYGRCIKQYNTSKDNGYNSEPFSVYVDEIIYFNRFYSIYKDATLSLNDGYCSSYIPYNPRHFELFESSEFVETTYSN